MRLELLTVPTLLLVTGLVFTPAVQHDFLVWDDDKNITANPIVSSASIDKLPVLWRAPYQGLYIPVTYSAWTLIAAAQLSLEPQDELSPVWFHTANIALHLVNTLLVLLLLWRLIDRRSLIPPVLGAAIFAIHPLQVEAVSWATGLKDVLSTTLALLALLFYLRNSESNLRRYARGSIHVSAWLRCLFALVCYGLAVLAKPAVVILPLVALTLETAFYRPTPARYGVVLGLFVASIAAVAWFTVTAQDTSNLALPLSPTPVWARPIIALDALGFYLIKLFLPLKLAVDYGHTPAAALGAFPPILLLIPFASLALIAAAAPGNRPQYTAAAAAAIIALSPTLGLVPFAFQAISTVADRYCYLAMVGVALAVALLIRNTQSSWPPFLALAIAGLFAAISSQQVTRWNSSVSLFDHTLTVNPQSVIAAYNLGIAKSNNEAPKEAITHYKNAIAINPNFQPAYNNLGYLLLMQNQPANALDPLKIAVSLDPDDPVARSNLGIAHDHLKQFPEAITQHKEALRLSPREPNNLIQLGYSLANHGKLEEAVDAFSNAHQLNPSNRLHLEGLEKIANQTKDAKAAQSARQALEDITQN